jgi:hypothetical protein
MYTLVVEGKYDSKKRFFGLCESCYWTATILREIEHYQCPICHNKEISLMPISKDEKYEYSIEPKKGLQIKFSLLHKK